MTVWYDFTTTVRNRGRSGIAGVEWNIGEALRASAPDVRCFELSGRRGLVELDPGVRLSSAAYASPDAVVAEVINATPTWRDDLRRTVRDRFGVRADPFIRALSTVYQMPHTVRRRLAQPTKPRARRERAERLVDLVTAEDVVVSMGADWDGQLAAALLDLKHRTGCAVVTMVYDLVPLTHTHLAFHNDPDLFERYYRSLIEVSDLITCISHQSRRDLLEFARDRGGKLPSAEVLVLGESSPLVDRRPSPDDFFLCVGTVERRKNIELVYDALRVIESEGRELPRVVVAGSRGWGTDDLLAELEQQSTASSRSMVLVGSVDVVSLDHLYHSARALLFPSHFEGWGLPVREAAIRGCPVAASDSPAIREAAAGYDGITFLPSDDAGAWADYMMTPTRRTDPAAQRTWSAVSDDLLAMVGSVHDGAASDAGRAPARSR